MSSHIMSLPYWHFAHNFRILKQALVSISLNFDISLDELVGIGKDSCIPVSGLSDFQIEIIKSLRKEYRSPTSCGGDLSAPQMKILHDIIKSFVEVHT